MLPPVPRKFFVGVAITAWLTYVITIVLYVLFFYKQDKFLNSNASRAEHKFI